MSKIGKECNLTCNFKLMRSVKDEVRFSLKILEGTTTASIKAECHRSKIYVLPDEQIYNSSDTSDEDHIAGGSNTNNPKQNVVLPNLHRSQRQQRPSHMRTLAVIANAIADLMNSPDTTRGRRTRRLSLRGRRPETIDVTERLNPSSTPGSATSDPEVQIRSTTEEANTGPSFQMIEDDEAGQDILNETLIISSVGNQLFEDLDLQTVISTIKNTYQEIPEKELKIRRNNIIKDVLQYYQDSTIINFKIKVIFEGEIGEDLGGLTRDMFLHFGKRHVRNFSKEKIALFPLFLSTEEEKLQIYLQLLEGCCVT
ncbi:unnamed protein product [Mytilus coruscus]|uniref:HECT domain-containing protein n=1 Tax=Mytilus coruscus TaxID=42192 RepID=A0A6J7ZYY3_MYTCO|nr:unnamed protein product [Mytilus coruscus]